MSTLSLTGAGPEAGGTAFSPLTLSPTVWYDFSTLALSDGTAIASINDLSGNSRTLTGAATAQPLAKTGANGINGLTVGLADGVNDVMTTATFALAQPFTVYAVITGGGLGLRYFAGATEAVRVGWDSPSGPSVFAGSTLSVANGTTAAPKVVTAVVNGVSSLIRVDGTQVTTGDTGAGTIAGGVALFASASEQFYNGKIGELLVAPTATVSTAYEASLKAKWGTP